MAKKHSSIKEAVEENFLRKLKAAFKDNLLSVMIYGSYVSGDFIPGTSDVNILVVLDQSVSERMTALGSGAHKFMRRYKITPLILTRTEFKNSADVFPMEYADIKDRNRVLFGEDESKPLALKRRNLRHQLEERLRGSVASLRQVIIASRGRRRVLENNLKFLFGSLKAVFRGLLRLSGREHIPTEGERIVDHIKNDFKVNTEPFYKLLKLRGGEKIAVEPLAYEVLASMEEIIRIVDKM